MKLLYEAIAWLVFGSFHLIQIFNPGIKRWLYARKAQSKLFPSQKVNQKTILIHCASLGEFEMIVPLIKLIKSQDEEIYISVSFFSESGFNHARHRDIVDGFLHSPVDVKLRVRAFLNRVGPDLVIFAANDIWYNLIWELQEQSIPFIFAASSFTRKSFWFKHSVLSSFIDALKSAKGIYLIENASRSLLQKRGFTNCEVIGNPRIDRVLQIKNNALALPPIEAFSTGEKTIVFGSVGREDMPLISKFYSKYPGWRMIIAPHHIEASILLEIDRIFEGSYLNYSQLQQNRNFTGRVAILDTFGYLSSVYRFGQLAYIGGGFGKGIHNILEPAVYGIPVIIGPNHRSFIEARELIQSGGAFCISTFEEFDGIKQYLDDTNNYQLAKSSLIDYIEMHKGGSKQIHSKMKLANLI